MPKRHHNNISESENTFDLLSEDSDRQNSVGENVFSGINTLKNKASVFFANVKDGAKIIARNLKVGANSASKNITAGAEYIGDNISCGKEEIKRQLEEKSVAVITKAQEDYEEKFKRKQRVIALTAELEITKTTLKAVFILLLITAVAFSYITSAWFVTTNKNYTSGMAVKTTITPNLVIASSVSELQSLTESDSSFSVRFLDEALGMKPSRHFFQSDAINNTYPINAGSTEYVTSTDTGLVYNTNPAKVTSDKGFESSGNILTFAAVPEYEIGNKRYYVDYTVYIASTVESMSISALNASIDCSNKTKDYLNAGSVDFYVGSVSESNYKGTLNVAGKNCDNSGSALTMVDLTGTYTVPHNTEGYITVIMRFYFDGGLEKSSNQAYVYTDGLTTADFNMTVSFNAVEA